METTQPLPNDHRLSVWKKPLRPKPPTIGDAIRRQPRRQIFIVSHLEFMRLQNDLWQQRELVSSTGVPHKLRQRLGRKEISQKCTVPVLHHLTKPSVSSVRYPRLVKSSMKTDYTTLPKDRWINWTHQYYPATPTQFMRVSCLVHHLQQTEQKP